MHYAAEQPAAGSSSSRDLKPPGPGAPGTSALTKTLQSLLKHEAMLVDRFRGDLSQLDPADAAVVAVALGRRRGAPLGSQEAPAGGVSGVVQGAKAKAISIVRAVLVLQLCCARE